LRSPQEIGDTTRSRVPQPQDNDPGNENTEFEDNDCDRLIELLISKFIIPTFTNTQFYFQMNSNERKTNPYKKILSHWTN